jgi:hypothetical protein
MVSCAGTFGGCSLTRCCGTWWAAGRLSPRLSASGSSSSRTGTVSGRSSPTATARYYAHHNEERNGGRRGGRGLKLYGIHNTGHKRVYFLLPRLSHIRNNLSGSYFFYFIPVLRNRIRTGFNEVPGSGSGSRRAKMTHKNRKKLINFIFFIF